MPKEKTPMEQLKQWVDDNYPNFNKADIESKIDELLPLERKMVEDAWNASTAATGSDDTGSQYFDNRFGK